MYFGLMCQLIFEGMLNCSVVGLGLP